jgi:hypothetical protein
VFVPPAATKRVGCTVHNGLPDAACTPGAVMPGVDLGAICHQSTRERRRVDARVHREAFAAYGIRTPPPRGAFEVDHLIPLELGGDNTLENLWAQPASPRPGFHEKDHVEVYLHREVCSGRMALADAQRAITTDWVVVWKQISGGAESEGLGTLGTSKPEDEDSAE